MMKHNLALKNTGVDTRMESEQPRPRFERALQRVKIQGEFPDGWIGWEIRNPVNGHICFHLINGQRTYIFYSRETITQAYEYLLDNGALWGFARDPNDSVCFKIPAYKQEER